MKFAYLLMNLKKKENREVEEATVPCTVFRQYLVWKLLSQMPQWRMSVEGGASFIK